MKSDEIWRLYTSVSLAAPCLLTGIALHPLLGVLLYVLVGFLLWYGTRPSTNFLIFFLWLPSLWSETVVDWTTL